MRANISFVIPHQLGWLILILRLDSGELSTDGGPSIDDDWVVSSTSCCQTQAADIAVEATLDALDCTKYKKEKEDKNNKEVIKTTLVLIPIVNAGT